MLHPGFFPAWRLRGQILKRIVILGSTGSIGRSTLEIVERQKESFLEVVGLVADTNIDQLEKQLDSFPGAVFALGKEDAHTTLTGRRPEMGARSAGTGNSGILKLLRETGPDLVVNGLVGIAGLSPTIEALRQGCQVALANKESLVTGGELIGQEKMEMRRIIPVDSEHFSLSMCLEGDRKDVSEIILTASGGPFYRRDYSELGDVTVREVLDHPTWDMGDKVTVDSALMLNKGFEVIEAHYLFDYPYRDIRVIIHPQSLVHSLVRLRDGSLLAHMGPADMKLPIINALYYPENVEFPWGTLKLEEIDKLEFVRFESANFPAFELAMKAAEEGGTAPAVLNAADEVAVRTFLSGNIGFLTIIEWIDNALSSHSTARVGGIEDIMEADRWTREFLASRYEEAVII
ncbi:MAG: 1-deoxy-D-xylulose-5-phosphate reductoisomerase [Candidatus Latescibacteria bacterium]|nr:1-deoxy-D-xylulose-5-phosphate reductoisomerase [bacterium]MBD3423028.1 1-deoxy-D-xylulose-5-phosphate reductoisomerase [Candidatus Latescibacterota bacterium]